MNFFNKLAGKALDILSLVEPVLKNIEENGIESKDQRFVASMAILALLQELKARKICTDAVFEEVKEKLHEWVEQKN